MVNERKITRTSFNPRVLMEKAVEIMRQSVPEGRVDGSPSPKVGAVLVCPDGSVVTAARGELLEGNHAEFILLERKCVGERLDGCVLFTTLDPCLNRNQPKRGRSFNILRSSAAIMRNPATNWATVARCTPKWAGVLDIGPWIGPRWTDRPMINQTLSVTVQRNLR